MKPFYYSVELRCWARSAPAPIFFSVLALNPPLGLGRWPSRFSAPPARLASARRGASSPKRGTARRGKASRGVGARSKRSAALAKRLAPAPLRGLRLPTPRALVASARRGASSPKRGTARQAKASRGVGGGSKKREARGLATRESTVWFAGRRTLAFRFLPPSVFPGRGTLVSPAVGGPQTSMRAPRAWAPMNEPKKGLLPSVIRPKAECCVWCGSAMPSARGARISIR